MSAKNFAKLDKLILITTLVLVPSEKINTIYTNKNNKLPTHKKTKLQSIKVKQIQQLVWYCHEMFKTFFDVEIDTEKNTHELTVKQFLISISNISELLNDKDDKKPILIHKYNFISLLQARIDGKRKLTSGRYIHEGGKEDEGIIMVFFDTAYFVFF